MGLELLKQKLFMHLDAGNFCLRYLASQFIHDRVKFLLICAFQILEFFSVQKGDEVWNRRHIESGRSILALRGIARSKH